MQGTIAIEPQGAPAIDRIDKHQLAGEILRRRRPTETLEVSPRHPWRPGLKGLAGSFFSWAKVKTAVAQLPSATRQPKRPDVTSHASTSEMMPLLSANFSVFTSIFWAIVSSKLLRWALLLTGLW